MQRAMIRDARDVMELRCASARLCFFERKTRGGQKTTDVERCSKKGRILFSIGNPNRNPNPNPNRNPNPIPLYLLFLPNMYILYTALS